MKTRHLAGLLVAVLAIPALTACNSSNGMTGSKRPVIRIYSELGPGQIRETTTVTLGTATLTLNLDQSNPSGYIEFLGDVPGQYPTTFSNTTVMLVNGQPTTFYGTGSGTVTAFGGRVDFQLWINTATSPATVYLKKR